MKKSARQNQKGFSAIVVILFLAVLGIVGYFVYQGGGFKKKVPESGLGDLPPMEERNNPLPTGAHSILVGDVNPGTLVVVREATLGSSAYLAVQKEGRNGSKSIVGKSELLAEGTHSDVTITTTSELQNSDVIYIVVQEANGVIAKDDNGNQIEVLKSVGMLAGHEEMDSDYY